MVLGICSEDAFITGLIPLFAKTFKLNVGKVPAHLKIMSGDQEVEKRDRKTRGAKISSFAPPCDCPQKLTCVAADDDSSEQTGGLHLARIAVVAG